MGCPVPPHDGTSGHNSTRRWRKGVPPLIPHSPHAALPARAQENRQVLAPATLTYSQVAQGTPSLPQAAPHGLHMPQDPSPASTESLLALHMEDYALSTSGPSLLHLSANPSPGYSVKDITTLQEDLFAKFSTILERGLANTAAQITKTIQSDQASLGSRMEVMEDKIDNTVSRNN